MSSGQLRNLSTAIGLVPSDTYRYVAPPPNSDPKDFMSLNTVKMTQTVDAVFRLK
ncbi:hypothetical protein [Rugamonas sp.]|uniref:hypothetical protein n=1 Tax=Rugamonas sp. TaxID=1926287 RepID=UPI0025FE9BFC|nr:hypothetical protein [Rugamonas sp.]